MSTTAKFHALFACFPLCLTDISSVYTTRVFEFYSYSSEFLSVDQHARMQCNVRHTFNLHLSAANDYRKDIRPSSFFSILLFKGKVLIIITQHHSSMYTF